MNRRRGAAQADLETDARERVHVARGGDGRRRVVVLDERHDDLGRHPARRAGEERRAARAAVERQVEVLQDLGEAEVSDCGHACVVDEDVSLWSFSTVGGGEGKEADVRLSGHRARW